MKPTLQGLRWSAGFSQSQAARLLKVDVMTISRWERGLARPRPARWQRLMIVYRASPHDLARALGVSQDEFVRVAWKEKQPRHARNKIRRGAIHAWKT